MITKLNFLEKKSWYENLKIPLSNSISPFLSPRGHLMDYPLPNVDNHGHLAYHHLPHFFHVVIERPRGRKAICDKKDFENLLILGMIVIFAF